ncbi:MAG: flagellar biosynthesis protein FliQ [Oligoflexia bacterium]|nr:flagellar biosynthesis protein FliQ [Oligoflexia bacterium]MBF0364592.1 flagellar biosynthesis protein FliQ [Oligoflexia bacterium]
MDESLIIDLTHESLKVTMYLGGPMLLGALITGVVVSLFQAVTQINEQTLSFIPKIIVIGASLVILGPWMSDVMISYTRDLIINIPQMIAQH